MIKTTLAIKREPLYRVKGVCNVMGTFASMAAVHHSPDEAKKGLYGAFGEIYRINDLMSVHKEDSEVSLLNRNGFYEGVSRDTKYVIQRANYFSELSDGVFDITILPLLKLWEESVRAKKLPAGVEIAKKLELVNYKNIMVEGNTVRFRKADIGITLAGVAKGYAVDKAIETLCGYNIKHALVNIGGDIRVIGRKTESMPWKIAVRKPRNKSRFSTTVELYDQAVATSGYYQRFFNDIIDPKAGKPARGMVSSTIITDKAIDADILSTCMFILGKKRGMQLIRTLEGVKAPIIE